MYDANQPNGRGSSTRGVLELNVDFVEHLLERVQRAPHPKHFLRQVTFDVVSHQFNAVAPLALKHAFLGYLQRLADVEYHLLEQPLLILSRVQCLYVLSNSVKISV